MCLYVLVGGRGGGGGVRGVRAVFWYDSFGGNDSHEYFKRSAVKTNGMGGGG